MAQTQTAPADKRGEGPAVITYADVEGKKDYKRVPGNVASVIVTDRATKTEKVYDVSSLPESVKNSLVAFAVATRAKSYINNHFDAENAEQNNAIALADSVYADLLNGNVYAKSESTAKPGKKFDPSIYVEAAVAAYKFMSEKKMNNKQGTPIKPMTESQQAEYATQLIALTPKERTEKIRAAKQNPYFAKALLQLQAKKIVTKSVEDGVEDLF